MSSEVGQEEVTLGHNYHVDRGCLYGDVWRFVE